MVRVTMRLCYLYWDDGDNVEASHTYEAMDGEAYDVCDKHAKLVKSNPELDVWEITEPIKER